MDKARSPNFSQFKLKLMLFLSVKFFSSVKNLGRKVKKTKLLIR